VLEYLLPRQNMIWIALALVVVWATVGAVAFLIIVASDDCYNPDLPDLLVALGFFCLFWPAAIISWCYFRWKDRQQNKP
jgi:hypothetical protein